LRIQDAPEELMASIPEDPRDQLLFFVDNPIVAGEPGGKALVANFTALVNGLLGGSSAKAGLFGGDPIAASAPVEGGPADDTGRSDHGNGGSHGGEGITLALGLLGGIARGDLDI
jgi:hypothetical protein